MKPTKYNCVAGNLATKKLTKQVKTISWQHPAHNNPSLGMTVNVEANDLVEIISAPRQVNSKQMINVFIPSKKVSVLLLWRVFAREFEMTQVNLVTEPKSAEEVLKSKKEKLANPGYYVGYLIEEDGSVHNTTSGWSADSVIYIGEDAKVKISAEYYETDEEMVAREDWQSLLWTKAPTRKFMETTNNLPASRFSAEMRFYYFKTHQKLKNSTLNITAYARENKAPNDNLA